MRNLALILLAGTAAILLAAVSRGTSPEASQASSHREAPRMFAGLQQLHGLLEEGGFEAATR